MNQLRGDRIPRCLPTIGAAWVAVAARGPQPGNALHGRGAASAGGGRQMQHKHTAHRRQRQSAIRALLRWRLTRQPQPRRSWGSGRSGTGQWYRLKGGLDGKYVLRRGDDDQQCSRIRRPPGGTQVVHRHGWAPLDVVGDSQLILNQMRTYRAPQRATLAHPTPRPDASATNLA